MEITKGATYNIKPGDYFNLLLPCGTLLQVEQTQDDFSIVRGNGTVAYTRPTSATAIAQDSDSTQTTGFN